MSAQILIRSGPRSGEALQLDKARVRIGSDPRCEISLEIPGLEPHSITIESTGDSYRISNRMGRSIAVGSRTVPPSQTDRVEFGEEINLAGTLVFSLEPTNAANVPTSMQKFAPDVAEDISPDDPGTSATEDALAPLTEESPRSGNKNSIQLIVIVFCFAMIPVMIIGKMIEQSSVKDATKPIALADLLNAVNEAEKQPGAKTQLREFIDQLRVAQALEKRNNRAKANAIYDNLLQVFHNRSSSRDSGQTARSNEATAEDPTTAIERQMQEYIKQRRSF